MEIYLTGECQKYMNTERYMIKLKCRLTLARRELDEVIMFRQVCDTSERVKKEVLDTPSIHGTKVLTNKK